MDRASELAPSKGSGTLVASLKATPTRRGYVFESPPHPQSNPINRKLYTSNITVETPPPARLPGHGQLCDTPDGGILA